MAADAPAPPPVRLGVTADDGVAATLFALVERGARARPGLASDLEGRVAFVFDEPGIAPARLAFGPDEILVEDGAWEDPDLTISGRLPHIVHLTTAPLVAGVPRPTDRRGRAALGRVARRELRIDGDRGLARRLLRLLEI
jgi:hypothetical protein